MVFQFRLDKKISRESKEQNKLPVTKNPLHIGAKKQEDKEKSDAVRFSSPVSSPRVTGFKERTEYEVIVEWDLSKVDRPMQFQRIGMKSWLTFPEAVADITRFVKSWNNVSHNNPKPLEVVRVVAIYEAKAFKDWSNDPYNSAEGKAMQKHIAEILHNVKKMKGKSTSKISKPISYVVR